MSDEASRFHEAVVESLLGLQARLRGEPEEEPVTVEERDLRVTATAGEALVRIARRLAGLEADLETIRGQLADRGDPMAERVVELERRLLREVEAQRADLLEAIDARFRQLEESVREAWRGALRDEQPPRAAGLFS
jgi:hypothetical protein